MADLSKIQPTDRVVDVLHPGPTKARVGLRLHLISVDDERLAKTRRAIADRRLHLDQRGKNFTAEQIEANGVKVAVDALTGWEWYNPTGVEGDEGYDASEAGNFEGEQPEFSRATATKVLTAVPWIAAFVRKEISDEESFFQSS